MHQRQPEEALSGARSPEADMIRLKSLSGRAPRPTEAGCKARCAAVDMTFSTLGAPEEHWDCLGHEPFLHRRAATSHTVPFW
jgi:hypothetical protein